MGWSEGAHPRGADGKWIHIGDQVKVQRGSRGVVGHVTKVDRESGFVHVATHAGTERAAPEHITQHGPQTVPTDSALRGMHDNHLVNHMIRAKAHGDTAGERRIALEVESRNRARVKGR